MFPSIKEQYDAYGQGHVFEFWHELSPTEQCKFAKALETIDVRRMQEIFQRATTKVDEQKGNIEPLDETYFDSTLGDFTSTKEARWLIKGLQAIREGKVAVILLAGGQGTRLGSTAPKGCFEILPGTSLFHLQAESIRKAILWASISSDHHERVRISWYVMVSESTSKPIEDYFDKNSYFGVNRDDVVFFKQGSLPAFTNDGKFMLDGKSSLARAPDGNGGIYSALERKGILDDFEKRGIQYVHVYCVDNCLVKVADPVFIGYCIERDADCGVKCVSKLYPQESIGIFCTRDGKPGAVEYSELDNVTMELRNEDGILTYNAANIANHFFTTKFLRRCAQTDLKYHVAKKKIPHINHSGHTITPTEPNKVRALHLRCCLASRTFRCSSC